MDWFPGWVDSFAALDDNGASKQSEELFKAGGLAGYRAPTMVAVKRLLSRDWFSRVWTVQEGACTENAVVLCGKKEFPFARLEKFNDMCQNDRNGSWSRMLLSISTATDTNPDLPPRAINDHIHTIHKLKQFRSKKDSSLTYVRLLQMLRSCGASDSRDKVYAIYQFFPELKQRIKSPDYEKKVPEVLFAEVAAFALQEEQNLDYLAAAGICQQQLKAIPSWVADLTYAARNQAFWILSNASMEKLGRPLYAATVKGVGPAPVALKDGLLQVHGKILDRISNLAPPFTLPPSQASEFGSSDDPKEKFARAQMVMLQLFAQRPAEIAQCQHLVSNLEKQNGKDMKQACRQTLVAGMQLQGDGSVMGGVMEKASDDELRAGFVAVENFASDQETWNQDYLNYIKTLSQGQLDPSKREKILQEMLKKQSDTADRFKKMQRVLETFQMAAKARVFFTTEKKSMGLAPKVAIEGDFVCVLYGCSIPLVIRKRETVDQYQLIGECYAHGIMDGEAMNNELKEETITFV